MDSIVYIKLAMIISMMKKNKTREGKTITFEGTELLVSIQGKENA